MQLDLPLRKRLFQHRVEPKGAAPDLARRSIVCMYVCLSIARLWLRRGLWTMTFEELLCIRDVGRRRLLYGVLTVHMRTILVLYFVLVETCCANACWESTGCSTVETHSHSPLWQARVLSCCISGIQMSSDATAVVLHTSLLLHGPPHCSRVHSDQFKFHLNSSRQEKMILLDVVTFQPPKALVSLTRTITVSQHNPPYIGSKPVLFLHDR